MRNLFKNIKFKYYPLLEAIKALSLIGFFLIGLSYIGNKENLPVYPKGVLEELFLYTFVGFLFLSWLLGERKKTLLTFAYFVTFQIVGLAYILHDPLVVPRVLVPTLLVYLSLFLFESPEEYIRKREKEKLESLKRELEYYKTRQEELQQEYHRLEEEKLKLQEAYKSAPSKELEELLFQKEEELKRAFDRIEELKGKLERLKENNRELWQLLEESMEQTDGSTPRGKEELKTLRRERRKLLKRVEKLENLLDEMKINNELLRLENRELKKRLEELSTKLEETERKLELKQSELERFLDLYERDLGSYLNLLLERVELTPAALADLVSLSEGAKRSFIKHLRKFERLDPEAVRAESLETAKGRIFKERFSGGRIYFTTRGGKFVVEGILEGEDKKSKDRFIRERFG